jgi:hypothetical protein
MKSNSDESSDSFTEEQNEEVININIGDNISSKKSESSQKVSLRKQYIACTELHAMVFKVPKQPQASEKFYSLEAYVKKLKDVVIYSDVPSSGDNSKDEITALDATLLGENKE